ncbi:MAG: alpha/beta hydrolase [Oscillospiraceae bacterium]|nr:alpha/beta hydrolase [Oscillospiraceae bacterium]
MVWLTAAAAVIIVAGLIALMTHTLLRICCGRQITGLAGLVIGRGQDNGSPTPPEAAEGRAFWRAAAPEPVSIRSFDGLVLRGEYLTRTGSVRTVVCVHGYRATGIDNFAPVLPVLAGMGCDILLIDQRACGASEGNAITFGMKERLDVLDWCRWLTGERGCTHPIFLDGISLGCSTVLMASDLELPANVRGIIADCGFTSAREIIASVMKRMLKIPPGPVMPLLQLAARIELGMPLDAVNTEECVRRTRIPILFAHGEQDHFVPPEMGKRNYAACASPKRLLLSPDAAHGETWLKSRKEYTRLIEELFACAFETPAQEV